MDRLFPKFNLKRQPRVVLNYKRMMRLRNRTQPPERVPFLSKLHNDAVSWREDELEALHHGLMDWTVPVPFLQAHQTPMPLSEAQRLLSQNDDTPKRLAAINSLILHKEPLPQVSHPRTSPSDMQDVLQAYTACLESDLAKAQQLLSTVCPIKVPIVKDVYEVLLEKHYRRRDLIAFDGVFQSYILEKQCVPSQSAVIRMINLHAQNDHVERAFRLLLDIQRIGFISTDVRVYEAMARALTKRTTQHYFPELVDLCRQVVVRELPTNGDLIRSLMLATGKLGLLDAVAKCWNSLPDRNDPTSAELLFWALAACETSDNRLSRHRGYRIDNNVHSQDICHLAKAVHGELSNIPHRCDIAYLALLCNHVAFEDAKGLFHARPTLQLDPQAWESMFGLCDRLKNWQEVQGLLKLHGRISASVALTYASYRHALRTLALGDRIKDACDLIPLLTAAYRELTKDRQNKLSFKDLKELYHRAYLQQQWDTLQLITDSCTQGRRLEKENPYRHVIERTHRMHHFLDKAYNPAPKLVTQLHDPNRKRLKKERREKLADAKQYPPLTGHPPLNTPV